MSQRLWGQPHNHNRAPSGLSTCPHRRPSERHQPQQHSTAPPARSKAVDTTREQHTQRTAAAPSYNGRSRAEQQPTEGTSSHEKMVIALTRGNTRRFAHVRLCRTEVHTKFYRIQQLVLVNKTATPESSSGVVGMAPWPRNPRRTAPHHTNRHATQGVRGRPSDKSVSLCGRYSAQETITASHTSPPPRNLFSPSHGLCFVGGEPPREGRVGETFG